MFRFSSPLHAETLTLQRAAQGETDAAGVPIPTPAAPMSLAGCNVQPSGSSETDDDGRQVVTTYRVSAPGIGLGVAAGQVASWRLPGVWLVEGDPLEFAGTGLLDHTEFLIRRVRG